MTILAEVLGTFIFTLPFTLFFSWLDKSLIRNLHEQVRLRQGETVSDIKGRRSLRARLPVAHDEDSQRRLHAKR